VTDLALVGTLPGRTEAGSCLWPRGRVRSRDCGVPSFELCQDAADHFAVSAAATKVAEGQQAPGAWIGPWRGPLDVCKRVHVAVLASRPPGRCPSKAKH